MLETVPVGMNPSPTDWIYLIAFAVAAALVIWIVLVGLRRPKNTP